MKYCVRLSSLLLPLLALASCQTALQNAELSIPRERASANHPQATIEEAAAALEQALQNGALGTAPYAVVAAEEYLATARKLKRQGDSANSREFAGLARMLAERAATEQQDSTLAEMPLDNEEAVLAHFNKLREQYEELDAGKAARISPLAFARLSAALSRSEYAIQARSWKKSTADLRLASWMMATLTQLDEDQDGVMDLFDEDPWHGEDVDGFEDEDGAPDLDNDGDGVPDALDAAPNEPETMNRWLDTDGAPDAYPTFDSIYFESGSAALSAESRGYLRGVAKFLQEWPALKLHVSGHTDDVHSPRYNTELSRRRADVVQRALLSSGVAREQLNVTSHGEKMPITAEDTEDYRNRRVDLVLE